MDRERAEKRKLKRQHHKELKGAVRELRKDNAFLAGEQAEQLVRTVAAENIGGIQAIDFGDRRAQLMRLPSG